MKNKHRFLPLIYIFISVKRNTITTNSKLLSEYKRYIQVFARHNGTYHTVYKAISDTGYISSVSQIYRVTSFSLKFKKAFVFPFIDGAIEGTLKQLLPTHSTKPKNRMTCL
jgi:hypothetical protein